MIVVTWSGTLTRLINAHAIETLLIVEEDECLQLLVTQPIKEVDIHQSLVLVGILKSCGTANSRRRHATFLSNSLQFILHLLLFLWYLG